MTKYFMTDVTQCVILCKLSKPFHQLQCHSWLIRAKTSCFSVFLPRWIKCRAV